MDLTVTREYDAPPDRVWAALTEPALVARWWGPAGFTAPVARMDVRPGGVSLVSMRSPDGFELYNTWTYGLVDPPRRLEYLLRFCDATGRPVPPSSLGLPADVPATGVPHELTLHPSAGGTELTVTERGYGTAETVHLSRLGLEQTLDKLAAVL
ncbi:SRPBCC family protein [Jiangella anatolica]|uniref:Activator of HSP90 ATPase n=1 Tax=Jiangella anatolica TaxID=2670374 RepID=A0A2W2BV29_9ACTN|nr:SRPBCC domain-containing protein [Jiangella anatolica]PZF83818.1 activator of HSP90 ATPase [Jiangella anatolica]